MSGTSFPRVVTLYKDTNSPSIRFRFDNINLSGYLIKAVISSNNGTPDIVITTELASPDGSTLVFDVEDGFLKFDYTQALVDILPLGRNSFIDFFLISSDETTEKIGSVYL